MDISGCKLGNRIQDYRTTKHITQEEFASLLDLSVNHISLIERGKRLPTLKTFIKIANVLGVSADDLLVDGLDRSLSVANTELNLLLLDCNEVEKQVFVELIKYLKPVLIRLGI